MQIRDVVEISGTNGRVPMGLIEASYRASQDRLVAFVLRGISPQTINHVLDPIVPTLPLDIPGVLYIDASDEARVREAVVSASTIFVATAAFRGLVRALGVAPNVLVPVSHAARHLRGLAAQTGNGCGRNPGIVAEQSGMRRRAPAIVSAKPQPPDERRFHLL